MLKDFIPKRRVIRAAQYTDDSTGLFLARVLAKEGFVIEWSGASYLGDGSKFKVRKESLFSVSIKNSWQTVKLDSWTVIEPDGSLKLYSDEEFKELYTAEEFKEV